MDFQVKKGGIVSDLIKKANLIQKKKKYKKFCTKTAEKRLLAKMEIKEHCESWRRQMTHVSKQCLIMRRSHAILILHLTGR